jgi:hypothetical protein
MTCEQADVATERGVGLAFRTTTLYATWDYSIRGLHIDLSTFNVAVQA